MEILALKICFNFVVLVGLGWGLLKLINWLTYRSPRADLKRYEEAQELEALRKQLKIAPLMRPELPQVRIPTQAPRVAQPGAVDRLHLRNTLDKFITEEADKRIEQRIRMARFFKDSVEPPRSGLQVKTNELAAIMESTKTKKKGKNGKRKKDK